MRVRNIIAACIAATALCGTALAVDLNVPMDRQLNVGLTSPQSPSGDAIYPLAGSGSTLSFGSDAAGGYAQIGMPGKGWYYGYLDPVLAGIGPVNLSAPGSTVGFDARFYQDPQTNSNPYADAPIFLRLYTYADDLNTLLGYRDYSIVWATQAPWNNPHYPVWSRAIVDVAGPGTVTNAFDPARVNRVRWYGTDWSGAGDDFVNIKNVTFSGRSVVPEPGSMSLLLAGLLPFAARLRRRKA